ncbi:type II toxin-antitoxin system death-on-curing family toxin [Pseudonocardia parietis]|uniref:Death-on-curing family protein n=1 Tax=Pseudonocardia parietis TaxID=570936 RepID=A0ABS4VPN5_9PSEU|nr:type II toxin-antitoxin system death-on-curing family toxin [Pseudonocardia parietis]MBP2365865.1 death-on-curing family protein [Pseudonocardia parietis]
MFGSDAYPTLAEKAAALLESLVRNHALVDGNKRLGRLATETFLALNDVHVSADDDVLFNLVIGVAEGRFPGVLAPAAAIADLTSPGTGR